MSNVPKKISESIEEAERILYTVDKAPFTEKAFDTLSERIKDYIGQLVVESIKVSKRKKADDVSSSHIEEAHQYLISKRKSKLHYLGGTLGGAFLGATISNFLAMTLLDTTFSTLGIITTSTVGIVGAFLIAMNMSTD